MTEFIINKRTDAWKTDVNLLNLHYSQYNTTTRISYNTNNNNNNNFIYPINLLTNILNYLHCYTIKLLMHDVFTVFLYKDDDDNDDDDDDDNDDDVLILTGLHYELTQLTIVAWYKCCISFCLISSEPGINIDFGCKKHGLNHGTRPHQAD